MLKPVLSVLKVTEIVDDVESASIDAHCLRSIKLVSDKLMAVQEFDGARLVVELSNDLVSAAESDMNFIPLEASRSKSFVLVFKQGNCLVD